jgi:hypothetical protein
MTKKEKEAEAARLKAEEEERKRKEAEAARLKAEEEERERKRKEEEEKKAKEKKPPAKGKPAKEEKVEEIVEETEEQKIEREKKEINEQLKVIQDEIEAFTKKMNLCAEQSVKIEAESKLPRVIELLEKEGDRKFMKNNAAKNGTELLRDRKAYVLAHIKKGNADEEVVENIVIDGFCMRTPEEDIKWEEEQKLKELEAAKGGKKGPPPKKK